MECFIDVNYLKLIQTAVQVFYTLSNLLSVTESGILKLPDIIVEPSISPLNFIKFCCIYFATVLFNSVCHKKKKKKYHRMGVPSVAQQVKDRALSL